MIDHTVAEQEAAAAVRWRRTWLEGPTRTRYQTLPPQVGEPAPDLVLPDHSGRERHLAEFWDEGPALLVFFRHYGCGCLAERWEELRSDLGDLRAAGATIVGIGQAPERTAAIVARRAYEIPVLADPDLAAYRAYGLLQGTPPTVLHDHPFSLNDEATAEEWMAERAGTERALVDDPWQLPGEFVVDAAGLIAHAHRYQYCEDFPPKGVLVGAIVAAHDGGR